MKPYAHLYRTNNKEIQMSICDGIVDGKYNQSGIKASNDRLLYGGPLPPGLILGNHGVVADLFLKSSFPMLKHGGRGET